MRLETISELAESTESKIVLLVADGLGGLAKPDNGLSELQVANTPNLDDLAAKSALGLTYPVAPGITPGSGPGHLSLFGYDPERFLIKRGIMEALGIGLELDSEDVAARGNFCTLDRLGNIVDRRAGRIATSVSRPLVGLLDGSLIDEVNIRVYPVREHRFVTIFHGAGLGEDLSESDPQRLGVPPSKIEALSQNGTRLADVANRFGVRAKEILNDRNDANGILLRGFSKYPDIPSMRDLFKLNPAAIASYPMYRGLASIVGMTVLDTAEGLNAELDVLKSSWDSHDFFFVHYKPTDSSGEDGDFEGKVAALELLDTAIPSILELEPDVLMIGGDHSTPALLGAHSWHPVPFLLHAKFSGRDGVKGFSELTCGKGSLGRFAAKDALILAMANSGKLGKFGA